ncbi:DUF1592 domain-containing protein [soil metagenome]
MNFPCSLSYFLASVCALPCLVFSADQKAAPKTTADFFSAHCIDCHDAETKKGDLDLSALNFDLNNLKTFAMWVKVHDRVRDGEMPPKKKPQPEVVEKATFLSDLAAPMITADQVRITAEGRATFRRMNRLEYENTLRDLLHAPWLQVKEILPEDGVLNRFNKVGDALDVSHVQMSRYLTAADYALREAMASQLSKPISKTIRYYSREQSGFTGKIKFSEFNRSPERATFPILGTAADIPVLEGTAPLTVGAKDPKKRELEAVGVVSSSYEPMEIKFNKFTAPQAGQYTLKFNAYSFWAGPDSPAKWWKPSRTNLSAGRRGEPVTVYAETPPRLLRKLGSFDVTAEPTIQELNVYLLKDETIRLDAVRLFRSRPPGSWHNPLAEKDGQPGVAFRWMEATGPIMDTWPSAGHKLLFGDLPLDKKPGQKKIEVVSVKPLVDAERLLRNFLQRAYRKPVAEEEVQRFMKVIRHALDSGSSFTEAMLAGYSAVLCSPAFVCLEEKPGKLDDFALATRLSLFLWNSEPDETLRAAAATGELHKPEVLKAQTTRLINDPKSRRFVDAFLDYWLDLRKSTATSPDAELYPDYYLDDLLAESAVEETQLFFTELLKNNLPSRHLIASDFVMVNERLATLYGIPAVQGVALRRVTLPKDSPRGGLMTQASVLKVTANGTTTSPVLRGAWIMERVLGQPPPPPPPSVPAVEPDTRGATTIREQLEKHRNVESCNACHAKIDPAGFALENFDVLGGWRDHYRAMGEGVHVTGYGKNGQPFAFHPAQPVDASGELPDGRKFQNIRDLKQLLLNDERQIARNLARQFIVYATGAPLRFGDRPELEKILDQAKSDTYGVSTLIQAVIQSELFQEK